MRRCCASAGCATYLPEALDFLISVLAFAQLLVERFPPDGLKSLKATGAFAFVSASAPRHPLSSTATANVRTGSWMRLPSLVRIALT